MFMLLENALKDYRPAIRLPSNIYIGYSINFERASIVIHYLFRDSNRNFITYWHNWDCWQWKYADT